MKFNQMGGSSCDTGFNILAIFKDLKKVLIYSLDGTVKPTKLMAPVT